MKNAYFAFLRIVFLVMLAVGGETVFPALAFAGGGPENVVIVVNRQSSDSMTIANHYLKLRQIPADNVVVLDWDPKVQTTDVESFRKKILIPILGAIQQRRLAPQIDYIVYSSDFPWGINLEVDKKKFLADAEKRIAEKHAKDDDAEPKKPTWPKPLTTVGSINGLTYLWQPVLAGSPVYMHLQNNFYMRRPVAEQKDEPTLGFKSTQRFGPNGERVDGKDKGMRYMLSTMLAVTSGRGNTIEEVLRYLRRSAAADGRNPRGTIYFMKNKDVRSTTRDHAFPEAVRELEKLGVAAEIIDGVLPRKKSDVQGAMIGAASFDWKSSGSTIRPGAICEHFTSFGGVMKASAGQTPLTELLRYGAAGASGTVTEPYSLQDKFPHASVQVHYARGCTLAEAFYQSVRGPYQLLIVGDPLCRPWANIPTVTVKGIEPEATIKGIVTLSPAGSLPRGGKIDRFDLFVDGLRTAACSPGGTLRLDTTPLADGHHELRVVAVEDGLIASQGRKIIPVTINNRGGEIRVSTTPKGVAHAGKPLVVTAASPKAIGIVILYNSRIIGRIAGSEGKTEIDSAALGFGPARLRVVAMGNGGPSSFVWAKPIILNVVK